MRDEPTEAETLADKVERWGRHKFTSPSAKRAGLVALLGDALAVIRREPNEQDVASFVGMIGRIPHRSLAKGYLADWYAERIAQARREALMNAANRVTVATTPTSPTFGAYMHAAQIVRETPYRGDT